MNHYEDYDSCLCGRNDEDEFTMTSINKDFIVVETHQNNGWIRKMYYHRDYTIEEMYDGKWTEENPDADCYEEDPLISLGNYFLKHGKKGKDAYELLCQYRKENQ